MREMQRSLPRESAMPCCSHFCSLRHREPLLSFAPDLADSGEQAAALIRKLSDKHLLMQVEETEEDGGQEVDSMSYAAGPPFSAWLPEKSEPVRWA